MSTLASPSTSLILVCRALHPLALAESIDSGDTIISERDAPPGGGEEEGSLWGGGVWGEGEGEEDAGTRRAAPGPVLNM